MSGFGWLLVPPGKIKVDTLTVLAQASLNSPLLVSVISVWEIASLESKGRLRLPMRVESGGSPAGSQRPQHQRPVSHTQPENHRLRQSRLRSGTRRITTIRVNN